MADVEEGMTLLAETLGKALGQPLSDMSLTHETRDTSADVNALDDMSFHSTVTVRMIHGEYTRQATGYSEANSRHKAAMSLLQDWDQILAQEAAAGVPPAAASDDEAAGDISAATPAALADSDPTNYKSILSQFMTKVLQRSVTKADMEFETLNTGEQENKPVFKSTVILTMDGRTQKISGPAICGPKKAAEQSAARQALQECPELQPLWASAVAASQTRTSAPSALSVPSVSAVSAHTADTTDALEEEATAPADKREVSPDQDSLPASCPQMEAFRISGML